LHFFLDLQIFIKNFIENKSQDNGAFRDYLMHLPKEIKEFKGKTI